MVVPYMDYAKAISPEKQREAMIGMGKFFLRQPQHEKDSNSRLGGDVPDKEVMKNE